MRKCKFFINFDKEEQWLNDMAKQGHRFINKSSRYEFQPAKPENRLIKIDFRTFKKQADFEDYRALFEDSGWKHIAGTKKSGSQYFEKIDEHGNEDIFSDADSKAGRYQRLSKMWLTLAVFYIPILVVLILTNTVDPAALLNPKLLYFTPGLWERTGAYFWRAFLFETPFVFFRGFFWFFFPVMIILYFAFGIKANMHYQKTLGKL